MKEMSEPVRGPNTTDILGSTIQTLIDRINNLESINISVHNKLYGEYQFTSKPGDEETADSPGRLASFTRELERIIYTISNITQVAESLDNQS